MKAPENPNNMDNTDNKPTTAIMPNVFEALGEVSMCWSETPKGIFDSNKATEIGNRLCNEIKEYATLRIAEYRAELLAQEGSELPDVEYNTTPLDSCDFGSSVQEWVSINDCESAISKLKKLASALLASERLKNEEKDKALNETLRLLKRWNKNSGEWKTLRSLIEEALNK